MTYPFLSKGYLLYFDLSEEKDCKIPDIPFLFASFNFPIHAPVSACLTERQGCSAFKVCFLPQPQALFSRGANPRRGRADPSSLSSLRPPVLPLPSHTTSHWGWNLSPVRGRILPPPAQEVSGDVLFPEPTLCLGVG